MTTATQIETARQFHALAPRSVKLGRKTYKRGGSLTEGASTVHFDYTGRKQRGAFLNDKIRVSVTLLPSDTYSVAIVAFDGMTLGDREISKVEGVDFNYFADLATWIARA